ncbi:unnamed protein product, partial [Adineta ricciae]
MTENNRFWINILRDYDSERIFPLPYDRHPIPNEKRSDQIWSSTFEFDSEMLQIIHQHAEELNTTIENLLFSSYYIFLFKLTNGEMDLYVGRNISIDHRIPFYLRIGPTWSFAQLLKQVTQMSACTKQHAHLPLSSIHSLKHPLKFPVVFYYGRQLLQQSPSDLSLCIVHDEQLNTLRYQVHASAHVFDQSTTQQLSQRFQCLFHQLFTSFDLNIQPIYQLSIILPHEHALLKHFHPLQTHSQKPTSTTIPHLFIQQAIKNPHKTAVTLDHSSLTYSQLLSQANQLAHTLIDDHHISEGDIVCQCMHRSIDMVIGILAIMMAGAIYVPLNPSDSSHRLDSLIQQIKPKLVLRRLPHTGHPYEQSPQLSITGESIAHIIFTSGSTGSPKGVQIRHRNFVSYMETHQFDDKDIILQLANCSFDVHVDEIVSALCRGAHLVLLRHGGHLDFDYLTSVIAERQVTFIAPVPSWIDGLCGYLRENSHACDRMRSIRWWFIGGEQLLSSTIRQLLPFIDEECHLLNTYGPAEITETATCYEVNRDEVSEMISIPIGRPLSGYRVFVVDEYGQEVVPGEQGEIVVGGVGVFGGYYGREELSKEVMMEVEGDLCYKTGDYGRIEVKNGELKFVGRKDFQIKLRGQRIELSMIESIILQSSGDVLNCVVIKEDSPNDSYLCAYIKIKECLNKKNIEDIVVRYCRNQLASYMTPSKWYFVPDLPLNANGKIDRQKLSSVSEVTDFTSASAPTMQLSPLEKKLEDIFIRSFGLKTLPDVSKSFGELGGTSLGAMHALILIRQEIYEQMDISLLFANPSIRQLATVLEPLLTRRSKFVEMAKEDEENFSIRPISSWVIETLGILLLAWLWIWPFYAIAHLDIYFFRLFLIPLIHLLQYPLCITLLRGSVLRGRDALYSCKYYRLWFLRHQWSLTRYWLGYLYGTRFYNIYLRLCGARVSNRAHIYTSYIDAPWLIEIGDFSYIGEEVVLSSISYHDRICELHEIHIGSYCSVAARSVLHDRVDMHDRVYVAPLTSITGRVLSNDETVVESSSASHLDYSIPQLIMILLLISIHSLVVEISWYIIARISVCWFSWLIVNASVGLLLLRFLVGNVEENFSHSINSWPFFRRFWLRRLVIHSFHPCFSTIFDGFNSLTPRILRWLGATIDNRNIEIADFVPLLSIPSNLLTIQSDVTTTSEICFVPYDITINSQCIVNGRTQINRGVFLGNNSLLQSGLSIPDNVLTGSLTRLDSKTIMHAGDILLGVPAQPMPFTLSYANETRKVSNDFQRIACELTYFVLLDLLLDTFVTSNILRFLLTVPIFMVIHSFTICIVYFYLMKNSTSTITLAMILYSQYTKYTGQLLGGTQWLVFLLRRFGAQIGNDVIIDEMNSLYDVHLITIGDHARLSSTCQIQCHTFEHRHLKLRPVNIGSNCIIKEMAFVLPGVEFHGHNYLYPCSLALPHDQFLRHTDWCGSPTKRLIVHYGIEPPRFILAKQQSSIDKYDVIVARTDDDILTLYFGDNGWMSWQSGLNLRQPYRPNDIYIRLFFTAFLCNTTPKRILAVGLGGGIWPLLIRHYFSAVIIDVVEIDRTVIKLATEFFGLAEQAKKNYLNVVEDDGYHYVTETAHRYDLIFIDAFVEDNIPTHISSQQFFLNLRQILNDNGCLITNV